MRFTHDLFTLLIAAVRVANILPLCLAFQAVLNSPVHPHSKLNGSIGGQVLPLEKRRRKEIWFDKSHVGNNVDDEGSVLLFAVRLKSKRDTLSERLDSITGCLIETNITIEKSHEIWILPSHSKQDVSETDDDFDIYTSMLHSLLKQHLYLEWKESEAGVSDGKTLKLDLRLDKCLDFGSDSTFQKAIEIVGFELSPLSHVLTMNLEKLLPHLHEFSFLHRGTEQGTIALESLGLLSQRRVSYEFQPDDSNDEEPHQKGRNIVSLQKNILPLNVIGQVSTAVSTIKNNGWLSTNPDSVDGLPSLHINLVSNGEAKFPNDDKNLSLQIEGGDASFGEYCAYIHDLIEPFIYGSVLQNVRDAVASNTVEISDVFLRSYGLDVTDKSNKLNDVEDTRRFGLSVHYDVLSSSTCVIALDSSASSGSSGLYTIKPESKRPSNHAALRQFFPLDVGDGVLHSFDILHGVDVDKRLGTERTSLIIWFVDYFGGDKKISAQPWLSNPKQDDDICQFVLGLASECNDDVKSVNLKQSELYLKSAASGNPFSLHSLGLLCDDGQLSETEMNGALKILRNLRQENPFLNEIEAITKSSSNAVYAQHLGKALWFEASMRGNRISQRALGDSLMAEYTNIEDGMKLEEYAEELVILATTFFAMAAQQGDEVAKDSLSRVMKIECSRQERKGVDPRSEEFFSKPVGKIALVSLVPIEQRIDA